MHALITDKLGYGNILYLGTPDKWVKRLETVQNAAAHLILGTRCQDSVARHLYKLHWLPSKKRITFQTDFCALVLL